MKIVAKKLWTNHGFESDAVIEIQDGIVTDISHGDQGDFACDIAAPGLIDQHVHGGFGVTVMHSGPDDMLKWLGFLLKNGVTQVLSGVYTAPIPVMRQALAVARDVMRRQTAGAGGAMLAGVHLEGPFISMQALGAMDAESVIAPTIANYDVLADGYEDIIRLVTVAPEVEGAHELIHYLTERGIHVQAGHTAATDAQGREAFCAGVRGITHFFNASTPIRHRAPGILAQALLEDDVYCECICDFVHVHDTCVKLIYRCKGSRRMIIVSDAVETTGLPDGIYEFGGATSIVTDGESRTLAGSLNGGSTTPLGEIRNLVDAGIPLWDALCMASRTPADFLGIEGGSIAISQRAEIVCLSDGLQPLLTVRGQVMAEGEQ